MSRTVIISDCHFGYERFNKPEFERFLDRLQKEDNVTRLVLLGDIFDLWRADPVDSFSLAYRYLERLQKLCTDTYYVVGSHDYHNWISCSTLDLQESFLGMKIYYPYLALDEDLFLIHGDYFDIHRLPMVEKAVHAVYEAIYYESEPVVRTLEKYFWSPLDLLKEWVKLYRKSPAKAKRDPLAAYLKAIVNMEKKGEVDMLDEGLKYLSDNRFGAVQMLVPAYMRLGLENELNSLLKGRITKEE